MIDKNIKLFDSHTHLVSENLTDSPKQIVDRATKNNVAYMVSICTDLNEMPTIELHTKKFSNVFGTLGVIPLEVNTVKNIEELKAIEGFAKRNQKIVAIGEIGLDYYWQNKNKEWQKTIFEEQLKIAQKLNLPVNIHCRDAYDDMYEILSKYPNIIKILHCFCQPWNVAERFVKIGCWFSIPGAITFKKSTEARKMVENLPIDKILIETDAPYLAPTPFRGKTNRPEWCFYTLKTIAETKKIDITKMAKIIFNNTVKVYDLERKKLVHEIN